VQWEDGVGGEEGGGEEGDAVSCVTAIGAHQSWRKSIKRRSLLWMTYMCCFIGMTDIQQVDPTWTADDDTTKTPLVLTLI